MVHHISVEKTKTKNIYSPTARHFLLMLITSPATHGCRIASNNSTRICCMLANLVVLVSLPHTYIHTYIKLIVRDD